MPKAAKYFHRQIKPRTLYTANLLRRNREVRDLFNRLCERHTRPYVLGFFATNYFMNETAIYHALRQVDKEPVDMEQASIQYREAIKESFRL